MPQNIVFTLEKKNGTPILKGPCPCKLEGATNNMIVTSLQNKRWSLRCLMCDKVFVIDDNTVDSEGNGQ